MKTRQPENNRKSTAGYVKLAWKKSGKQVSLKAFARQLLKEDKKVEDWFFNKTANTSNPPKGIGNTRKKNKR